MIAIGYMLLASFGNNTVVVGLACNPTAPASMQVSVGPGAIVSPNVIETTPFGSLPADTTDALVKMGINIASTLYTLTAPTTAGQSQNYLVQVSFSEADDTPATLTYYNSLNPAQPFTGPANSGTPQNTRRAQRANLQIVVGTPANTGSQVTPPVSSGWVGLYVISVAYGATAITAQNVSAYPNAPFLAAFLSSHHGGIPGQAPKINLASEVQGILALANLPANVLTGSFPAVRTQVTSALTLYVNPTTGNDSNNGLATTTALATINKAWAILQDKYDHNGFNPTIQLANGTYAQAAISGSLVGASGASLIGNAGSPSSVVIAGTTGPALYITLTPLLISGFTVTATGTSELGNNLGYGLLVGTSGIVTQIGPIALGAGENQLTASNGGVYYINGQTISVVAGGTSSLVALNGGILDVSGGTVAVSGTQTFTQFANADALANIIAVSATFTGTVTGVKYSSAANAIIQTNGAGANYFPGSSAGTTSNGGLYI